MLGKGVLSIGQPNSYYASTNGILLSQIAFQFICTQVHAADKC